jgi:hypothetical protein
MADNKSELAEIKRFGGKPQKNSGRGWRKKGDATLGPFLVDVKEFGKTFGLSRSVWAKISTDAIRNERKQPALNVVLGDTLRLWVVEEKMFMEMLEAWEEKYAEHN